MFSRTHHGGASVQARDRIPSTDLTALLELLVAAYPDPASTTSLSPRALSYDVATKRLRLDTYSVIRRVLVNPNLKQRFKTGDASGFLRDVEGAERRATVKMGGRLLNNDLEGVATQVAALKRRISDEFDALAITPSALLVRDPAAALAVLTRQLNVPDVGAPLRATLVPIAFAPPQGSRSERRRDVARVISAVEHIQGEDWLDRLAMSTGQAMALRDDEFDVIERENLSETLRQERDRPDSQVATFLAFLEDDALARVRLYVTFSIMASLADQKGVSMDASGEDLCTYVHRARAVFDLYAAPASEQVLHLNLSGTYGIDAEFSMADELARAHFYGCLPVWAQWNTQILEDRRAGDTPASATVMRDVSYRFRINGRDPVTGSHAFDVRRARLRRSLVDDHDLTLTTPLRRRRDLAQLVFLWLVLNPDIDPEHLHDHAQALAARLERGGRSGVARLLDDLDRWSDRVATLGARLAALLASRSSAVLAQTQRDAQDLYLVVQRGIINWEAVGRLGGKASEPLVRADKAGSDNVEWFKYIKVARRPEEVPDALFSVRIVTTLRERILAAQDDAVTTLTVRREVPPALLNVVWQPIHAWGRPPSAWAERTQLDPAWRMGAGVDIVYDPALLTPRQTTDRRILPVDAQQYRAAGTAALATLVYAVLHVLVERLEQAEGTRIPTVMLRFQTQGREALDGDGETQIYAAAQAVEAALMSDVPLRMQGMVHRPSQAHHRHKQRGTAVALASAFPLIIGLPHPVSASAAPSGTPIADVVRPNIALIAYATRPCDMHPRHPRADGSIFRAKTYLAEPVAEADAYRIAFDRMQSYIVESRDDFERPTLIVEEVSRLHGLGYDHILLLSSDFGNRRINRTAQRHSPHTRTAFLDEASEKFPDVMLYMLRRDVFPAARLHLRQPKRESGFEALRLGDHRAFAAAPEAGMLKQLVPTYTFCTLSIVGHDDGTRPQSGFCTYFLDTDYQVRDVEWREQARATILSPRSPIRPALLAVLRGLHFLEAEHLPEGTLCRAVLDPFDWVTPDTSEAAGEIQAMGRNGRGAAVVLSLPALLSRVSDALHSHNR